VSRRQRTSEEQATSASVRVRWRGGSSDLLTRSLFEFVLLGLASAAGCSASVSRRRSSRTGSRRLSCPSGYGGLSAEAGMSAWDLLGSSLRGRSREPREGRPGGALARLGSGALALRLFGALDVDASVRDTSWVVPSGAAGEKSERDVGRHVASCDLQDFEGHPLFSFVRDGAKRRGRPRTRLRPGERGPAATFLRGGEQRRLFLSGLVPLGRDRGLRTCSPFPGDAGAGREAKVVEVG